MTRHRFQEVLERPVTTDRVRPAVVSTAGFMVCPLAVQQWVSCRECQWDVYQQAWQQALELAKPSILDRFEAALLN